MEYWCFRSACWSFSWGATLASKEEGTTGRRLATLRLQSLPAFLFLSVSQCCCLTGDFEAKISSVEGLGWKAVALEPKSVFWWEGTDPSLLGPEHAPLRLQSFSLFLEWIKVGSERAPLWLFKAASFSFSFALLTFESCLVDRRYRKTSCFTDWGQESSWSHYLAFVVSQVLDFCSIY